MLKSALITAATTLAMTFGAFGIAGASADTRVTAATVQVDFRGGHADHWQGPRWHNDRRHGDRHVRGPVRICKPIVRTVKVHGHHGWRFQRVTVGERCHFVRRGW